MRMEVELPDKVYMVFVPSDEDPVEIEGSLEKLLEKHGIKLKKKHRNTLLKYIRGYVNTVRENTDRAKRIIKKYLKRFGETLYEMLGISGEIEFSYIPPPMVLAIQHRKEAFAVGPLRLASYAPSISFLGGMIDKEELAFRTVVTHLLMKEVAKKLKVIDKVEIVRGGLDVLLGYTMLTLSLASYFVYNENPGEKVSREVLEMLAHPPWLESIVKLRIGMVYSRILGLMSYNLASLLKNFEVSIDSAKILRIFFNTTIETVKRASVIDEVMELLEGFDDLLKLDDIGILTYVEIFSNFLERFSKANTIEENSDILYI